ncbi:hypothetical protein G9A89_019712 [Geosiphon pyriformis]|nr:hypothetical protein G9A89_019712 [Geosiphon pyriformis]
MSVLRNTNLHWSSLISVKCTKYGKISHTLLNCAESGKIFSGKLLCRMLSDADKSRLAVIYAKHSASVIYSVSFGGLSWAKVVGKSLFSLLFGQVVLLNIGFSLKMKSFLLVVTEINNRFVTLKCSLVSLAEHVDMLAKRLKAPKPTVFQLSPEC